MATTLTAGVVPDSNYSIVSILHNPTANTSSSSFSEASHTLAFPQNPSLDSLSSSNEQSDTTQSSTEVIIEALRSKDRLFVLKLGEQMESLITERKQRIDLNPATSYQRLLVHRCSAYYKLAPENDPSSKGILIYHTAESKIPSRRISELVPIEETAQPAFKIMRRNFQDRHRLKSQPSHLGSVAGDDADLSDIDPSETGSQGGRSNATGSSSKRLMTIEEREAAYNKARSRIFMDFEEKEKGKEKDTSACSSTLSLVSGSASTSAGRDSGSVGDIDDSVSTAATESEWSGPVAREKIRRSGSGNNSAGSSSRSLRSFNANGGSSHGSRATSPSFSYASLYEPSPTTYEAPQYFSPPPVGYVPPYMYSYPPPPGQAQGQPMMPPYPYYPPYPYHHPQQPPQHPHSDPTSPTGGEGMFPPPSHPHSQPLSYPPPYIWPHGHPPPPPPPQHAHSVPPQTLHRSSASQPTSNIPLAQNPQYSVPFMPPPAPYGPYSMSYYPPHPPGAPGPPPHFQGQHGYTHNIPPLMNGTNNVSGMNGVEPNRGRRDGNSGGNNAGRRNTPKVRSAWSYGSGTSVAGYPYGSGETVGPRLSSAMRRTSGNSSTGSGGNRTPGDEASSTASSSTTSSSSRRTYTSTSSKHPLPARPDWAVGLKPQPTLSQHRQHDQNNPNARSSSGHNNMQSQSNLQQLPPVFFQSADFPPLSNMAPPPPKRTPTITGAWTNPSSTRSIMTPAPSNGSPHSSALIHYHNGMNQEGNERPTSKGNNELFNPKGAKRQSVGSTQDKAKGEAVSEALLVGRMENMALEEGSSLDNGLEIGEAAGGEGPWSGEIRIDSLER